MQPPCRSPAQAWSLPCVPRPGGPWRGRKCSCLSACTPEPLRASGQRSAQQSPDPTRHGSTEQEAARATGPRRGRGEGRVCPRAGGPQPDGEDRISRQPKGPAGNGSISFCRSARPRPSTPQSVGGFQLWRCWGDRPAPAHCWHLRGQAGSQPPTQGQLGGSSSVQSRQFETEAPRGPQGYEDPGSELTTTGPQKSLRARED